MTQFRSRSLSVLDRLYNFIGGTRGLNRFDLAGAIQPVHDFSREAELGSRGTEANSGYLSIGDTLTNASMGATTIFSSRDVYASFDLVGALNDFSSRLHRLWLIDIFGTVTVDGDQGNWSSSGAGIKYQDPVRVRLLKNWNDDLGPLASLEDRPMVADETRSPVPFTRPIYLPFIPTLPTLLQSTSVSTDDCEVRIHWLFWAGPIGTTPPGMR